MCSRGVLSWAEDPEGRLTGPGSPFEMVEEDVLGTTMRVFAKRPRSMLEVLRTSAGVFADRPFLVFPDRTLTYGSILPAVAAVASSLHSEFGISKGERVAIAGANIWEHALAAWAVVSLGGVVVELNGWWAADELESGIELARPSLVLADRTRRERLSRPGVVCLEEEIEQLESKGRGAILADPGIAEDDPLCILFTSGTTGRPKGAVLTHRCHIHMMMQSALQGALAVELASTPAASVSIGVSPMFHISGFSVALIGGAMLGLTIAYPPAGRWDPVVHMEMTERHRATAWSIVPTQLWRILEHPRLAEFDLSSLQRIGGGGSTFAPELWRLVREKLPQVTRMATGYGMTETCGAGTHHDGRAAVDHPEAVGAPVASYEIGIRGPDGGWVQGGATGEICLRGPSNLAAYWGDLEATEAVLSSERWYRTGELGHVAGGLLYLDGREAIVRGGENVYPIEIENRLVEHPAIAEAAVIGVPDKVMGEEVKAVVVVQEGASVDLDEVRSWVGEKLAAFKIPTLLEVVRELPRNAAGKVQKNLLGQGA